MYGQYNPYNMGAVPQMQQRLSALQGYQQQMYQPQAATNCNQLKGRPVTSIEEAKAAQIDLDGSSTFFPCPAKCEIYEKAIDLNGLPVFRVYKAVEHTAESPIAALQKRIERLEQSLKGVVNNESNGTNDEIEQQ